MTRGRRATQRKKDDDEAGIPNGTKASDSNESTKTRARARASGEPLEHAVTGTAGPLARREGSPLMPQGRVVL